MRELAGGQRIVSNQAMQALNLLVKEQLAWFTLNDKLVSWANVKCWSCGRPMAYEKTVCWRNVAVDFGGLFRVYTPVFRCRPCRRECNVFTSDFERGVPQGSLPTFAWDRLGNTIVTQDCFDF